MTQDIEDSDDLLAYENEIYNEDNSNERLVISIQS